MIEKEKYIFSGEVAMKMVFFGGVHGVGKTTLLEKIAVESDQKPRIVDPGELFWEHLFEKKDKTPEETEELAIELIARECRLHPVVICNWHYAVWTPSGYVPEIAFPRLTMLVERVKPECVYLVLMSASVDAVFERRAKDRAVKKRKIDRGCIEEEMAQTERLYHLHRDTIASIAKTITMTLDNTCPVEQVRVEELRKIFYETS